MSPKPRVARETECLTLRVSAESNRQFEAVIATRGRIPKNLAFELIVARLYRALLSKLDEEGVELLQLGSSIKLPGASSAFATNAARWKW
jgi:hypothetical protein